MSSVVTSITNLNDHVLIILTNNLVPFDPLGVQIILLSTLYAIALDLQSYSHPMFDRPTKKKNSFLGVQDFILVLTVNECLCV